MMEKIKIIANILFLTIFLIFSISLIAAGFAHAGKPKSFEHRNCTIHSQELVQTSNNEWLNTWNNRTIVESVFSSHKIEWFSDQYQINATYPCLCSSICYLHVKTMEYVRYSEMVFEYGSNVMIIIGFLMLVGILIYSIIICKRNLQSKFVYIAEEG